MSFSLESALVCTVQLHEQSVGFWCPDIAPILFPAGCSPLQQEGRGAGHEMYCLWAIRPRLGPRKLMTLISTQTS
jgi:hypothetical protein